MRSAEARAVAERAASNTGSRVQPTRPARNLRGPHPRVSGHDCRRSVRRSPRLHFRPRRYGVSPGPAGDLASERVT
jgi:hypothetical protein